MNTTTVPSAKDQPVCFVIMGFRVKPALDRDKKVRMLDLDKTYEALIKPAVEAAGLRCVRADEVQHSGLIDRPMYEMLLSADLVVADISGKEVYKKALRLNDIDSPTRIAEDLARFVIDLEDKLGR